MLLDLRMPRMDGYEACRAIRAHPRTQNALVIALTGCGQDVDRTASKAAGFDRHCIKPVDVDELMRAINGTRDAQATKVSSA